ncbi:flavodoxin family protein [Candidatus Saccharibacteria bacterium]|jgi:flavodoxin|nr:flavodoxin family protein [Candidatus Saccharibacteria bacterium]
MIQAIYASTSGNVEYVMTQIAKIEPRVKLLRAEYIDSKSFDSDIFIFATSTWAHGEVNPIFVPALEQIVNRDMTGKKAFFIGLGDNRYEPVLFCEAINITRRAFDASGGRSLGKTFRLNGDPYTQEDKVEDWVENMLQKELINA